MEIIIERNGQQVCSFIQDLSRHAYTSNPCENSVNNVFFPLCLPSAQKHASMGQCVKSSRYLSIIPPVTVECAEVDGDSSSIPIFFEDRYLSTKGIISKFTDFQEHFISKTPGL